MRSLKERIYLKSKVPKGHIYFLSERSFRLKMDHERYKLKAKMSCICLKVGLYLAEELFKRHNDMCSFRVSNGRKFEMCMFR